MRAVSGGASCTEPLGVAGIILVGLASTGPAWLIAGWMLPLLFFAAGEVVHIGRWCVALLALAITATVLILAFRIPTVFVPGCPLDGATLYVAGDSISAGLGQDSEAAWPAVYARRYDAPLVNFARAGATLRSAAEQVRQIPDDATLVLLEIGGNDHGEVVIW